MHYLLMTRYFSLQVPFNVALMTKNGLRIPCMCHRCGGACKDWRTVQNHAKKDAADQPLYPASLDSPFEYKVDQIDNEMQDPPQQEPPIPDMDQPAADIVSHVEALPNCHLPVYETV
jgi:hypothetical protein